MSSNNDYLIDDYGESSDWIEIYNSSDNSINLGEYYLTDDPDDLTKWGFPNQIITPHSFVLVFASGRDISQSNQTLHTNFKIKSSGEKLYLSKAVEVIHQVPAISLEEDKSYGLFPDGGTLFTYFDNPSAGKSNSQNINVSDILVFSIDNPAVASGTLLKIDNADTNFKVFYTIDGTNPSPSSLSYPSHGLFLENNLFSSYEINQQVITPPADHNPPSNAVIKAIVLRVASFDFSGNQMSVISTKTYFLKDNQPYDFTLPIVSLVMDPQDLMDNDSGIFIPGVHFDPGNVKYTGNYYKIGRDWEKDVSFEYYDFESNTEIVQQCGLRIHGDGSRKLPQKALRIYARSEYGKSWLDYPFFESNTYDEYKRLILRPFSASWTDAGITDYLTGRLAKNIKIESLSTRPVSLFLNGEYWGLYFLQERLDERHIASFADVDNDSVDIIHSWQGHVTAGSNNDYLRLYDFIESNDLFTAANYDIVQRWMDIPSFVDYQLFQIFISNYDWPANNMKCWRKQETGAKWKWVFFDGDAAFLDVGTNNFEHAQDTSSQGWPTNAESTLFLRKLLKNPTFYELWNNKMIELLDETFSYDKTSLMLKDVTNEVNNSLVMQYERFGKPASVSSWNNEVNRFYRFLSGRRCIMYAQASQLFDEEYSFNGCLNIGNDIDNYVLYPNPVNNELNLQFNSDEVAKAQVIIYNLIGQKVVVSEIGIFPGINNYKFDLSTEVSGTYIWQLRTSNETFRKKIQVY
jgi:hypothetical protein